MDFSSYQAMAIATDQVPFGSDNAIIVPLLGLAGEAGELLTEYKNIYAMERLINSSQSA